MTREELTNRFLESNSTNYILQVATGFGKSRLALQKIDTWYTEECKILIVIPKLVLIPNWKEEIKKWKYEKMLNSITFTTYVSLPKYCGEKWDVVLLDEAHHTSERCREAMDCLHSRVKHLIALSATLKREMLAYFRYSWKAELFKVDVKDAIEDNVLPDPKIILLPLSLDKSNVNQIIEKKSKRTDVRPLTISFADKWKYKSYTGPLRILCTQQQYYDDLSNLIEWYKQKGKSNAIMKNMWLHKAGERLKWLAKQKEEIIKSILKQLKNHRVLTFCQSIEQSASLGCPCVNIKVGLDALARFNAKAIKHISAVAMVDEGCNLSDCKIGLFQMINASDRMVCQRVGRILRHKEPVLIFPYYRNTREEEIINEIIKDYNPNLITRVFSYNNIKQYL